MRQLTQPINPKRKKQIEDAKRKRDRYRRDDEYREKMIKRTKEWTEKKKKEDSIYAELCTIRRHISNYRDYIKSSLATLERQEKKLLSLIEKRDQLVAIRKKISDSRSHQ